MQRVRHAPQTAPLAAASSVLQRPSGASMPALLKRPELRKLAMNCTPALAAAAMAPLPMATRAMCAVTMEEEHAVSTASDGPLQQGRREQRLER